jgi:hypothetical protein
MFLTQTDRITCIHEPFCDAYHFGPERLSERFEDERVRIESGFSQSTYKIVLDNIQKAHVEVSHRMVQVKIACIHSLFNPSKDVAKPVLGKTDVH